MNALAKVFNKIGYLTCLRLFLYSPMVSNSQALRKGFYLDLWLLSPIIGFFSSDQME